MSWPAEPEPGDSWNQNGAGGNNDVWGGGGGAGFGDENFSPTNVSKHANADYGGARDGGCRICHDEGHFARDCPQKPAGGGDGCFRCGQEGHMRPDCPNAPARSGACYACGEEGHNKSECPNKPAETCRTCGKEGHIATDCTVNRVLAQISTLEICQDDAWIQLEQADGQKDVEEIKKAWLSSTDSPFMFVADNIAKAVLAYASTFPELRFEELEETFRKAHMNTYLVAKEQQVSDTHTIVNLQGATGQKYVLSFQFSSRPRRAKFAEGWPSTPEENMSRLAEAGFVMDSLIPKCSNCDEMGHTRGKCPEEKREPANKIVVSCAKCHGEGHRARDCTEPVPERAERAPKTCRNCDSEDHVAKDCTEPKNMAKVQCRNCDEFGHTGRECPQPTDWSRVECSNCHEKGHSYKRCKKPAAVDSGNEGDGMDAGGDGGGWGNSAENNGGGSGWGADEKASKGGDGGWATAEKSSGGDGGGGWNAGEAATSGNW